MLQVLVIEDNPLNRELIVTRLRQAGHAALQTDTAVQGLMLARSARSARPDVILMDWHLPDMEGLAATRLLKADPLTGDIPVVALTPFAGKGDEEKSIAAGCEGCLVKPVRREDLLQTLEAVRARNALRPED